MHRGRDLCQTSDHSIQFNCLYRWHATTSQADEQWVEKMSSRTFPGKKTDEVHNNFIVAYLISDLHLHIVL